MGLSAAYSGNKAAFTFRRASSRSVIIASWRSSRSGSAPRPSIMAIPDFGMAMPGDIDASGIIGLPIGISIPGCMAIRPLIAWAASAKASQRGSCADVRASSPFRVASRPALIPRPCMSAMPILPPPIMDAPGFAAATFAAGAGWCVA